MFLQSHHVKTSYCLSYAWLTSSSMFVPSCNCHNLSCIVCLGVFHKLLDFLINLMERNHEKRVAVERLSCVRLAELTINDFWQFSIPYLSLVHTEVYWVLLIIFPFVVVLALMGLLGCFALIKLSVVRHCQNEGKYPDFNHMSINQQSISLPILPLTLLLCGMSFLMRSMLPPPL